MKIGNVVTGLPALQKLAGESLTPKTLYWVSKLLSKLDKDIDFFSTERNKLVQEYGDEVEDGKFQVKPENRPDFERRMNELLDIEIEGDFKPVKLPTSEHITLSYNDLRMLEGFVELDLIDE